MSELVAPSFSTCTHWIPNWPE